MRGGAREDGHHLLVVHLSGPELKIRSVELGGELRDDNSGESELRGMDDGEFEAREPGSPGDREQGDEE
jgi:hypothetical protein